MRITKLIPLLTAGALMFGVAACSDDGENPSCNDYSAVSGTPSFKNDIMPIFQQSCNFTSCHNNGVASPAEDLVLGPASGETITDADLAVIHGALVGQPSERSNLNLVEAGDPGASWLMAKIDYETADLAGCADNNCTTCGVSMPLGNPLIAESSRTLVAAWIASGAPNN